jgi:hemoglobin/transferrin/lactoferrin receptor protein
MKKYILIWVLCLACTSTLLSQIVTVIDKVTLEKLPGVNIGMIGATALTTNAEGQTDISALKEKKAIQFYLIGYDALELNYEQIASMQWKIAMTERSFYIDEVVVSANKFEEKREDVAQKIQVLSQSDMRFFNQQTTADVLQQSGNVLVQKSQQGGGSPIIRGFEANKLLIVVDGVRMNNAIYRGGHLQDVMTLDNTILDKAEIVYGPGSVVYGSDALGGVMHFYTRNPEFSADSALLIKGNTFIRHSTANQEMSGHFDLNIGGKKFSSLSSFTFSSFDDLRQGNVRSPYQLGVWGRPEYVDRIDGKDSIVVNSNPNVQVGSGYKQYDALQKFSFKSSEFVTHTLNFQYSTSSDVPRYDRLTQYRSGKLRFAEWYYGPQNRLLASYNLMLNKSNKAFDHAKFIASYQNIDQSRNSRSRNSSTLDSQLENVAVIALNADLEKIIGEHELRYGLEFTYNDVSSTATAKNIETDSTWKIPTRYPDGGSTMQSLAAYLTHSWEVKPWLIISEGVRLSNVQLEAQFNDTTFFPFPFRRINQNNTAINGNIGIVVKPGHDWRISLLGSSGFRAANVDDLAKVFETVGATRDPNTFQLVELGNLIVPNPNLKPEYTYNADLGISKTIQKKVTIDATAFYTAYRDAITTGRGTLNGDSIALYAGDSAFVTTSINNAHAFLYGFSGQISARVTNSFDISSSLNYTYGRITDGENDETPLDHIPPVFGKTSFNLQLKKFRAECWVMYSGWKRIEDYRLNAEDNEANATDKGMPAWYTLNLRTAYQINNHFSVQLAVENLLDQNYRQFASNISAPGRNFMATIRARF